MRLLPFSPAIPWRRRGVDAAVGALGALGMAPLYVWPATLASLAWLALRLVGRGDWRAGFSTGFWAGFGFFAAGMFWIAQAFVERGPEYIPLIVPLVLGLFWLLALFWGAAGAAFVALRARGGAEGSVGLSAREAFLFAALFFLAEWARGHAFGGFPWNLAGYAWEPGTPLSQAASWAGVWGLTLWMWVLAGLLAAGWARRRAAPRRAGALGAVAAAALVLQGGWGMWRLETTALPPDVDGVRLRLVHVPFRQRDMMDLEQSVGITNAYFRETLARPLDGGGEGEGGAEGRPVTHIVWPEGAVRDLAADNPSFLGVLPQFLDAPPDFLFTSIRVERGPSADYPGGGTRYFNTGVSVGYADGGGAGSGGGVPAVQAFADKHRLVPFGETVPGGGVLEALGLEALAASFTPAPGKATARYPGLPPVSVRICYEVLFAGLAPLGEARAPWILNQSNDAWFGGLHGPAQHAGVARMRALEEGVGLVRAAANGESGTVDALGRWRVRMGREARGSVDVAIPGALPPTPFRGWIDRVWALLCLLWVAIAAVVGFGKYRRFQE